MSYGQCVFKYMVIVEADVKGGDRRENLTLNTSITLYGLSPGISYAVTVHTMAGACHTNKSAGKKFAVALNGEFITKHNQTMATSRCKSMFVIVRVSYRIFW